jgi:pimeloyl-ACP methyl ester carboxylesterase
MLNTAGNDSGGTDTTRRSVVQSLSAMLGLSVLPGAAELATAQTGQSSAALYDPAVLPPSMRSRFIDNGNGLSMRVLEAGFAPGKRPAVVLLHGFPELAYSWRKVMPRLAAAGFHVIAPDLRGYGGTTDWDVKYDDDLTPFRTLNQVRDVLGLVYACGYTSVAAVAGHDFGAPLAAWCAIVRPDVFRSLVLMSGPFSGTPSFPFNTADNPHAGQAADQHSDSIDDELAHLNPPRKHYGRYYATREANPDMWHAPQGVHNFLRAYYYMKSADWPGNSPFPLNSWTAEELAKIPRYYIMDLDKGMAETVAPEMPSAAQIAACQWLPDDELRVYSDEYRRTGFQGGLEGYRVGRDPSNGAELRMYSGRTIDVPTLFIAGKKDWNVYQRPGAFERMQQKECTRLRGVHLLDGAGHWVQQEQADQVSRLMIQFLQS